MQNCIVTGVRRVLAFPTLQLLGLFLVLDPTAGFLFTLYLHDVLHSRFFRLARDLGFAEICQYLKFIVILAMFARWNRRRRSGLIRAWIILFGVMLADDALGLHEDLAVHLGRW